MNAIQAERFSLEHGQPAGRARSIYDVIDLHMLAEAPPGSANEVARRVREGWNIIRSSVPAITAGRALLGER